MNYKTNTSELTTVADAIREKGGTSTPLIYPFGYISAIQDIQAGGIDELINKTISSKYRNSNVTIVGQNAFMYCSELTEVNFPRVTLISTNAFAYCSALGTANFLVCTEIGEQAFYFCGSLTTASFPSCQYVGSNAFAFTPLHNVIFPSCTTISNSAFYSCSRLNTVSFPNCTSMGGWAFVNCSTLLSVDFPVLTSIPTTAFQSCYSLSIASFGDLSSGIQQLAFARCSRLVSLYLTRSSVVSLYHSNAFSSTPIAGYTVYAGQYGSIYVPASLLTDYQTATNWTYYSSRFVGV